MSYARAAAAALLLLGLTLASTTATAQVGFLELDGVEGEAVHAGHEGWIDILSVSYDWKAPASAGRAQGRVRIDGLTVHKSPDATTPAVVEALTRGRVLASATLHLTGRSDDGRETVVLAFEMTDVRVTALAMADGQERVSLSFERATIAHPESSTEIEVTASPGR